MTSASDRPDEDGLIARFLAPLATHPGADRLTDDAATLAPPPGMEFVLTVDALAAGVHFFPDDPPATIAAKALRVNLSDLAAKGADPVGYLMVLALPADWTVDWLTAFVGGLAADQAAFGLSLLGGDTIRSPDRLQLSITAVGQVPAGAAVRRKGARPGDRLFVTGTIGDAALGLLLRTDPARAAGWGLIGGAAAFLADRYLLPRPRVAAAAAVRTYAHAAMDISDGLVGDLERLCRVSGVSAEIDAARVPLSPPAGRVVATDPAALSAVLAGGDDYELLVAVPPEMAAAFVEAMRKMGLPVTEIGQVTAAGDRPAVTVAHGPALTRGRFDHF
ncbi:thiamine-phosphate kinase [Segnochrobactraceae bacterium EtOH-i3]